MLRACSKPALIVLASYPRFSKLCASSSLRCCWRAYQRKVPMKYSMRDAGASLGSAPASHCSNDRWTSSSRFALWWAEQEVKSGTSMHTPSSKAADQHATQVHAPPQRTHNVGHLDRTLLTVIVVPTLLFHLRWLGCCWHSSCCF